MHIGVIPDGVKERITLRSERFPRPLFEVMGTMLLSRAVMAGVHFGVFDRLQKRPRTAAELASEVECDAHGMELLLEALAACGYLEQENGRYRNTPGSARWLLSDTPQTLANFVLFNYDQWDWTNHLEEYIKRGEARDIHEKLDEPHWRRYLLGLRDIATLSADEVVSKLRFSAPPHSLLDVGGGHAYYAIAMCRRHPSLRATIVDLEPATRVGRELAEKGGLSDRIEFRAGALGETDLGADHNAAFLFNVIHHLGEETNRRGFQQLHSALAPAGQLVVWESFREEREKQRQDQLGSLLGLFFGLVSRRQTYEFNQVAGWARAAGFARIRRERLQTAPFAALLVATK